MAYNYVGLSFMMPRCSFKQEGDGVMRIVIISTWINTRSLSKVNLMFIGYEATTVIEV